jgi:hypothetical protein
LHVGYTFGKSGVSAGGTYLYANPLNGCANPLFQLPGSPNFNCQLLTAPQAIAGGNPQHLNPDNTLPGYSLSTFYETYLQYEKNGLFARIGDQVISTPWAWSADTRIKPHSFQGADIAYQISPRFDVEVTGITRFQPRTTNDWLQTTLLTAALTGGFQYGRLGYKQGPVVANLHYYHFDDLAYFEWLDAKYTYARPEKIQPFVAIQVGNERSVGSSIVGKINSQVYGMQIGATILKNVTLAVSADVIPHRIENLPTGFTCNAATGMITPAQSFPAPTAGFFVGLNVPQCFNNPTGPAQVVFGGIASPYTDSEGTDPLFTTSLTQGMVDRRSSGDSQKVQLTYTSSDKRLIAYVSEAWYNYGFSSFPDTTVEFNADALYRLSPVRSGLYRGLSLRYRYGARTDDHSAAIDHQNRPGTFFGSLPYFVYSRAQLEYDF